MLKPRTEYAVIRAQLALAFAGLLYYRKNLVSWIQLAAWDKLCDLRCYQISLLISCLDDQMSCLDHVVHPQEVTLVGVFSWSIVLNCDLMVFFHTTGQAKIPPKLPFSLRTKVTSREDSEAPGSPLNNIRCLTHWWRNNPQLWLIAPPQPLSTTC